MKFAIESCKPESCNRKEENKKKLELFLTKIENGK